MCQIDTIPPTSAEASIRKQIAERNNVSESYVARSEKFMRGVQIMDQMIPGMQEKILSGQFKVRDADMHRLARADFPNRKQIVHEILHPEDRPAPQKRIYGINYSALEAAVRRIQQDVDFLMKYLPKVPDDAYPLIPMKSSTVWHGHSTQPSLPAGTARRGNGHLSGRGSSILLAQDRSVA